ncbi:hypothetical protein GCM10009625_36640 [Brachybacterium fresconis]
MSKTIELLEDSIEVICVGTAQEQGQGGGVLDGLTCALAEVGSHRVGGVSE